MSGRCIHCMELYPKSGCHGIQNMLEKYTERNSKLKLHVNASLLYMDQIFSVHVYKKKKISVF